MAKEPIVIKSWVGGQSSDLKQGIDHSFAYSRHVDFRKAASAISVLPATAEDTSGIILGIPLNMIEVEGEVRYAVDDAGNVYMQAANVWSKMATNINSFQFGMAYIRHLDLLLLTSNTTISTVNNAGSNFGSPTAAADTIGPVLDQSLTTSGNTYGTATGIDEGVTNRQTFTPDVEPLYSVKLYVEAKGTGDVTVTLHDAINNVLGSKTLAVASITNGAMNEWVITPSPRMNVRPNASDYHIHVTHDSSGGKTGSTLRTTTAADLETAQFETYAVRLVDEVEHFALDFLQYVCICNERYLAVWEPITTTPSKLEFLQHRLVFPPGYQGLGLAIYTDYIAIAAGRWSDTSQGVSDGKIFFWDGTSTTYNFVLDIPEGSPQGLFSRLNTLFYVAAGGLYAYNGGMPQKVWQFPNTDTEYKSLSGVTYENPQMMAVRNGILLAAFPESTFDPAIEMGVYSFGAREKDYPSVPGYSYTISTGTRTNNPSSTSAQIGFLKAFGNDLYMGWADYTSGNRYGIDKVSSSSAPSAEAELQSRILDNSRPDKRKQATSLEITFEALPTGASITPKYKIDRGSWVLGTPSTTIGAVTVRQSINKSYKEIQLGVDIVAAATTPKITSMVLIWDTLASEAD